MGRVGQNGLHASIETIKASNSTPTPVEMEKLPTPIPGIQEDSKSSSADEVLVTPGNTKNIVGLKSQENSII